MTFKNWPTQKIHHVLTVMLREVIFSNSYAQRMCLCLKFPPNTVAFPCLPFLPSFYLQRTAICTHATSSCWHLKAPYSPQHLVVWELQAQLVKPLCMSMTLFLNATVFSSSELCKNVSLGYFTMRVSKLMESVIPTNNTGWKLEYSENFAI